MTLFQQVTWGNSPGSLANGSEIVSAEKGLYSRMHGGTVGLGMRLEIDRSALPSGAVVKEITAGSAAHNSGKIVVGDVLE